ncbi:hypothetical protein LCGC14_2099450 [marine sediment metagenome]|uniref:Uncharacterized protein n=1 Tax=marine sediment metagenome TaxID=412755 RepID=A0A0F9EAA4_9ZZZZ|nr:hypothetical protein [Candidatus Scalindua sp.]
MAKELPYFRFYAGEWLNKDVTLQTMENQGVFINVCSYYWIEDCDLTLKNLHRRFPLHITLIDELIEEGIIDFEDGGKISISFLNEQRAKLLKTHLRLAKSGRKGGKSKAKARVKPGLSYKDKDKDNEKDKDKYRAFAHLSLSNEEFESIKATGYTKQRIDDILDSIENFKNNTKYKSLNLTVRSWLRKEKEKVVAVANVQPKYKPIELTDTPAPMPDSLRKRMDRIGK